MNLRGLGRIRRIARRATNRFVPHAMILLYHRVIELPQDPQLLCVKPAHFAEHLAVLRKWGRPLHLQSLGAALANRTGSSMIIVTFDDGYADNLYNAKPLLARYDVPATVFVTAGYIGAKREFWYDDLERIFLSPQPLPETLRLEMKGRLYESTLESVGDQDNREARERWDIGKKYDPSARHRTYRALFEMLHPLPDEERQDVLDRLAAWAGMDVVQRSTHRTLGTEELRLLARDRLIEIGAHTVTHPVLSRLPLRTQSQEIARSKVLLEEFLGDRLKSFAYPFGGRSHYTEATVAAVREAGFDNACSNFPGAVRRGSDPWQLPRYVVRDWDGAEFERQLEGWADA
jgi:peptidoglycan/xylan/chitin deacetylase (PgdA/CDA1 family)